MSINAKKYLNDLYGQLYRVARVPGSQPARVNDENAEAKMLVISSLMNWVNLTATLDDAVSGEQSELQNNQVVATWTSIVAIAAMKTNEQPESWAGVHLRDMRIQQLAQTINSCRG